MASTYPAAPDTLLDVPPAGDPQDNLAGMQHRTTHQKITDALRAMQSTLGTNPQAGFSSVSARLDQFVATTDSRLTGARTPSAHASTHASGGSDPVSPTSIGAVAYPTGGSDGQPLVKSGAGVAWSSGQALLPSQTGNSGKFLTTNGTAASWADAPAGGGGATFPLGCAENPVTDPAAARPTGLPCVWWKTATQPTNWLAGADFWVKAAS